MKKNKEGKELESEGKTFLVLQKRSVSKEVTFKQSFEKMGISQRAIKEINFQGISVIKIVMWKHV